MTSRSASVAGPARGRPTERHVAFIRNVMIGRDGLTREVLVKAVDDAGGLDPRSYLSTGNVSFTAPAKTLPALERRLETSITAIRGQNEPIFIRSIAYLTELADGVWFPDTIDVHERCVTFLPPHSHWTSTLPVSSRRGDVTLVATTGSEVFSVTRLVGGRPGTAGPMIEKDLGAAVTTRNWNTISRILKTPY